MNGTLCLASHVDLTNCELISMYLLKMKTGYELLLYVHLGILLQDIDTKVISTVMGYKNYYTNSLIFNTLILRIYMSD